MRIAKTLFFCIVALSMGPLACLATTYTWNGATTAWALNTNWSPNGVPGPGDNVIIVNAAAQPLLNATQSITDFTITSGILNLNTFTLTVTGVAAYTAGAINNGTMSSSGTSTTFSGTIFGASVVASSQTLLLNGSTFNSPVNLTKTGAGNSLGSGGNTFNSTAVITNNGSAFLALANVNPDIFGSTVTFNNTGTHELHVAYNATGSQFNGDVTFNNAATALSIFSNDGIGATVAYNGNIIVSNSSAAGGISFGTLGGTATLANTKTITVGGGGFATGTLLLREFTQTGATAQSLTLTGTALLTTGPSAIFNGAVTFSSPQVLLNGARFNLTASITKSGATQNNSNGGNVFVGAATLSNTGSGIFQMGTSAIDTFNDLTVSNTGTSTIQLATNVAGHQFNGNIAFQQAATGVGIFFCSGTGTAALANTKTLSVTGGFSAGALNLTKFTQVGGTAQSLTFTGTALLRMGPSVTFNGNVTFVSPQVLLNGCTFVGTAAITKNGATDNVSIGGNTFGGTTTITCSGSGTFELGDTSPETFNGALTMANTAQGRIQIGISSVGNVFNGDVTINHGGNTSGLNTIIARNAGCTATINGTLRLNCTNTNTGSGIIIANDAAVTVNGNIIVSSTNGRGVLLGATGTGTVTLANGFTVTDNGAGTFTTGTLTMNKLIQTGGTAQAITLTGTANLLLDGNTTFNGAANFVAPQIFLHGATFNNTAAITKNGATGNTSDGGNVFNGVTTITSSGTGLLRLANASADDFNGNVTFVNSGAGGLEPAYAQNSTLSANITTTSTAAIVFGAGGGTAVLDGANAQTISKGGAANPTFTKLQINKTVNDVTLNTQILIATQLTFTQRYILSSSANPVTFGSAATYSGAANASFVSGPVKKTGNSAFTFPVGKSAHLRPITISAPAVATDEFTAEYFLTNPGPTYSAASKDPSINHISPCEFWTLDRTTGASNVSVTLTWDNPCAGVTNLADLLVAGWDGTTWKDLGNGGTTGTTATGTVISAAPVTVFGPFTLASTTTNNPLPIELTVFSVRVEKNAVNIDWTTESEKENAYFSIQKTTDGEKFQEIIRVKGSGTSFDTRHYHEVDLNPVEGLSYYRLKQVDFSGEYKYSKLVAINYSGDKTLRLALYPNPSDGHVDVSISGLANSAQVIEMRVYTTTGTLVISKLIDTSEATSGIGMTFLRDLAPGLYIISVSDGQDLVHQKLLVH